MVWLPCPYLGREVELTAEREPHIAEGHPRLAPVRERIREALSAPDRVSRRSWRHGQLLFVKQLDEADFAVVVTQDDEPVDDERPPRTWVVTAFQTPYEPLSEVVWVKP